MKGWTLLASTILAQRSSLGPSTTFSDGYDHTNRLVRRDIQSSGAPNPSSAPMNAHSSERSSPLTTSLEEGEFELSNFFVPLGISASPSWWSRVRKRHGAPEGRFYVAGTIV